MISLESIPTNALGSFTPRTSFGFSAAADVHEFFTDENDPNPNLRGVGHWRVRESGSEKYGRAFILNTAVDLRAAQFGGVRSTY
jgi:hypothetical protein